MAKKKITHAQAKEWVEAASEATQTLHELTKALSSLNVEGFTEEGIAEMASSLMAASRSTADTAVHLMLHGQILRQRRELEVIKGKQD
jgi:hypothetical protein